MEKLRLIRRELVHHAPFSILSVTLGLIGIGILTVLLPEGDPALVAGKMGALFHVFHPAHMLFSSLATTVMFWQREHRVGKAILVGFVGSAGICGISDIFLPFLSGLLLGARMELHVCLIRHPWTVLPFLGLGILVGLFATGTIEKHEGVIFSHSLHVFVSACASIAYLVSFGFGDWIHHIGAVLVYMVIAVVVPCCTSDIVFPLLCAGEYPDAHPHHP